MSRTIIHDSILFGATTLHYRIVRSNERKTLGITVAQGQVIVAVPAGTRASAIRSVVEKKGAWIVTKLDEDRRQHKRWPRRLVSGEAISYLGRQYALKVTRSAREQPGQLTLWGGAFHLSLPAHLASQRFLEEGRKLFRLWFKRRLEPRIRSTVAHYATALNLPIPPCQVRDLGSRWGSCHPRSGLHFHWQLASASPRAIDFVVAHEVCHLLHPDHSSEFFRLLSRLVPNWQFLEPQLSQTTRFDRSHQLAAG